MKNFWIILALILCIFIIFLWSPWEVVNNSINNKTAVSSFTE